MCMADVARVVVVSDDGITANVVVRGREQRVSLVMVDEATPPIAGGDWLLVHSGLALGRIDAADAASRTRLLNELTGGVS
jgi:hydrogenase assembly chaperone HypC/HupF